MNRGMWLSSLWCLEVRMWALMSISRTSASWSDAYLGKGLGRHLGLSVWKMGILKYSAQQQVRIQ